MREKFLTGLIVVFACFSVSISMTPASAAEPSRMLFITQSAGFTHGAVKRGEAELAPAEIAITQLGQQSGLFTVDCTQDTAADFTKENLAKYDIVAFYTTGNLPIADADLDYFTNKWAKQKGHGILGFHSAGDTFHNDSRYWELMGGSFIGHAWNAGSTVHFTIHEPSDPLLVPFAKAANEDGHFVIKDEIYQHRHMQPGRFRVLMSLDYAHSPTSKGVNTFYGYHVPLAWVRSIGEGKLYYNNLGHNNTTWTNDAYLKSIENAVRWFRGEVEVDTTPNPAVWAAEELKARREFDAGKFKSEPNDRG